LSSAIGTEYIVSKAGRIRRRDDHIPDAW